ncbi:hypothetical protein KI387_043924 [Taxus chinensis]|uniref:Uncharacterized protein n=1 Tax=Taxus chinensis TaxID=29808 RepID=A0AA38GLM2_TAXCH|nr:hypothetical protein KI387_043924 [Taxus chinensis]
MDTNRPVRPKSSQGALCQMGQRDARDADRRRSRKPTSSSATCHRPNEGQREAHFGRIGEFMSQTVWDIRDKKTRRARKSRQGRGPINA